jgi:hypothetical protein
VIFDEAFEVLRSIYGSQIGVTPKGDHLRMAKLNPSNPDKNQVILSLLETTRRSLDVGANEIDQPRNRGLTS